MSARLTRSLERFRAKWIPVRVKKTRQIKAESPIGSDSIRTDRVLVGATLHWPQLSQPSDRYRPDIDGLRAIAVLLVVWFHAFPEAMPGGFIGVDIFFVISGFLITGIIMRELDQQRLSLLGCYRRRITRIFPAL